MIESGDITDDDINEYTIYQMICDNWFPILQSDIAVYNFFDVIHPADLLYSWLRGDRGNGLKKDEKNVRDLSGITLLQQIKKAARLLSKHLYSYLVDNIPKKCLVTLFEPSNRNLTETSLCLSLLYQRQVH